MPKRHAESPSQGGEFTCCGLSFDAYETEGPDDVEEPIVFARPGERVTCQACRDYVKAVRAIRLDPPTKAQRPPRRGREGVMDDLRPLA